MELAIIYNDGSQTTDVLNLTKKLGRGKLFVYEAYSPTRKANYALKIFPKTKFGVTQYSKEKLMFPLKHQNIIERIPITCEDKTFYPLLTEYAPYGDFFELVTKGCLSGEVVVRTYFHQLIEGLEYIHSQGIAHLDLKLENIMLGADFKLKIIDFDQAQPLKDDLITSGGTVCYRAPEVINGTCMDLAAADVYGAGIILFAFMAKQFPFNEKEDPTNTDVNCYSTFVKNNKLFWLGKIRRKNKTGQRGSFTKDFIELLNGMWNADPAMRFTLEEIKASKWYQGPVIDNETLKTQMMLTIDCLLNGEN